MGELLYLWRIAADTQQENRWIEVKVSDWLVQGIVSEGYWGAYFTDVGLRNAQLNFRQQEENHIMENIIYNELQIRGFNVDVGVVEHSERDENDKVVRKRLKVDFVCNRGNQRYYIQSAFAIPDSSKMQQ